MLDKLSVSLLFPGDPLAESSPESIFPDMGITKGRILQHIEAENQFRAVIFDVSGVLEFQGIVYPGAVELLKSLRQKKVAIRILTNSTLSSRQDCAAKLNRMGFDINEEEVVTASYATAAFLRKIRPKSCWVMLTGKGLEEFADLPLDPETPEYIVVGDYRDGFNFKNMNKALKLLLNKSKLIVMIPEKVDHGLGEVELTVGAYGRMLEDAAQIPAIYIGKPYSGIYEMTLETLGIPKSEVLMIGDRIEIDILGANLCGIQSVLVKTGEFRISDLRGNIQPTYIIDSIVDLQKFFL
jgi:HAD superfamily hydrolase (TIGR01458 family)